VHGPGMFHSVARQVKTVADLKGLKDLEELKPDIVRCAAELKAFGLEAQAAGEALKSIGAQATTAPTD